MQVCLRHIYSSVFFKGVVKQTIKCYTAAFSLRDSFMILHLLQRGMTHLYTSVQPINKFTIMSSVQRADPCMTIRRGQKNRSSFVPVTYEVLCSGLVTRRRPDKPIKQCALGAAPLHLNRPEDSAVPRRTTLQVYLDIYQVYKQSLKLLARCGFYSHVNLWFSQRQTMRIVCAPQHKALQ